jgi:hypothetical protein
MASIRVKIGRLEQAALPTQWERRSGGPLLFAKSHEISQWWGVVAVVHESALIEAFEELGCVLIDLDASGVK